MGINMAEKKPLENNNAVKLTKITSEELFSIAEIMFDQGKPVLLTVTGNSMYPFLRHGVDRVEICRAGMRDIKVADIALIRRDGGAYVLHRVFKKNETEFYMVGDAQNYLDGPYNTFHLIGKVVSIYRGDRHIPCSSLRLRFLVRLWMLMRPVRLPIIKGYTKLRGGKGKKR